MAAQSIGRYRILRELGRGATATVYLARDPGSGRQVAVKILAPAFTSAPDFAERFEQTLKALVALEHPYLLSPHDYGRDEDQFFVVMRYLPGGTLADRMDGRPMLLAEVVPLLQRLAEALDAAHTAHLLHGDIHPADVLFDLHERVVLADLGLAQLLDPVAGPSPTGTAAYMSPEQIAGQAIDGRADVYALGIVLYEMLTGRQPYAGATPQELLQQHLDQPVPQLSAAELTHLVLPQEFNQVIARALAKNRDYRYPTAGVLAEAVRTTFLMAPGDSSAEAEPPPAPPPFPVMPQRPPPSAIVPPPAIVPTPAIVVPPAAPPAPQPPVEPARRGVSPPIAPPAVADETVIAAPVVPIPVPVADTTAPPAEPPPPITPIDETAPASTPAPEPIPVPAVVPVMAVPAENPVPHELVREPAAVAPPVRRGPAPGSLLLGVLGIAIVVIFLLSWVRSPGLRAIFLTPTATPTATASPTVTASVTASPSVTPSATASATPSSTLTATASPTVTPSRTATASATPLPSDTPAASMTPTRRPTLAPFTPTSAPSNTPAPPAGATAGPTLAHLGPPPSATP